MVASQVVLAQFASVSCAYVGAHMVGHPDRLGHISFGPFILRSRERELERDGSVVRIGSRALDILIALVERAGEVVAHRALWERVWPDAVVNESGIRVHIAGLRKALGESGAGGRYITNVPGRGYSFVAPIKISMSNSSLPSITSLVAASSAILPGCLERMIGRDELIPELVRKLLSSRFVTIVAPGGMGKTTVALSVAHALVPVFNGEAFLVDFGSLTDFRLIATTISSALRIAAHDGDPASSLTASLSGRRLLLILDNCEHMIEAIAPWAERLYLETEGVHILATSREALRVEGEQVYRLAALQTPSDTRSPTAEYVLRFPAAQLFVERAFAGGMVGPLSDADAPIVARICGSLDGLPLAIELAAGRVNAYGLQGTATLLENRFRLDWRGKRTALSRHQTLNAMLDWSYKLLSETEQSILQRLSIFNGSFDFDAARSVVAFRNCSDDSLTEALAGLVEKSMIACLVEAGAVVYRLLDTTRIYASKKLSDAGDAHLVSVRHARHVTRVLGKIKNRAPDGKETASFEIGLGNIRKALEWCFSESGDRSIGISLVAVASEPFLKASLFGEGSDWAELALAVLSNRDRGTAVDMALQEAGWSALQAASQGAHRPHRPARTLDVDANLEVSRSVGSTGVLLRSDAQRMSGANKSGCDSGGGALPPGSSRLVLATVDHLERADKNCGRASAPRRRLDDLLLLGGATPRLSPGPHSATRESLVGREG
jgi:predicted ATPase/DNA-binding winged helix-turn-helix (wHTH) protein